MFVPSIFSNVLEIKDTTDTFYLQFVKMVEGYIDDVFFFFCGAFVDYIYPDELKIEDTTNTAMSA